MTMVCHEVFGGYNKFNNFFLNYAQFLSEQNFNTEKTDPG